MARRIRTLTARELNRTLLARQLLLRRRRPAVLGAVERLVGLQAQVPRDAYVALWSRLEGFRPEALAGLLTERRVVRMPLLRATLHLVTDADAVTLRPVVDDVLRRRLLAQRQFREALDGLDARELVAVGARLLEAEARSRAAIVPALTERWPDRDAASLATAITYLLPVVQVTPRGLWGRSGPAAFTTVEGWLDRPLEAAAEPDGVALRYLRAFGPATIGDAQTWSGLAELRPVFERLRPRLRAFRDERGRELLDVPRAPLPDPDIPAPVRFLPEYDNALLAHDDRSRIVSADDQPGLFTAGWGHLLVDGFVAGRWRLLERKDRLLERKGGRPARSALVVEPTRPLSRSERTAVADEARGLLAFLTDGSDGRVDLRAEVAS